MPATPEVVCFEVMHQHIAVVTLNRPEQRNAINGAVAAALGEIVIRTEADPDIWVVVLTGAGGKAFCVGADLNEVSDGKLQTLFTAEGGFAGFVHAKRRKSWIAAVDGYAVADGFEIMLACELVVASENSAFSLPEVKRGLIAAAGGAYRAARILPRTIAFELLATGGWLTAELGFDFGLINRLVPTGESLEGALNLASEIAANAPIAVQESLAIARLALDLSDSELRRLSDEAQLRIALTEDFNEGPLAFVEKRSPRWTGRYKDH